MRAMMVTVTMDGIVVIGEGHGQRGVGDGGGARGAMYDPSAVYYMDKLVADADAAGVVDIRQSPEENIAALARSKECEPEDITVCMLDRPRHEERIWHIG